MNLKFKVRKKPIVLDAEIARKDMIIHNSTGDVEVHKGDVIITGANGEQRPMSRDIFDMTYDIVTKENE